MAKTAAIKGFGTLVEYITTLPSTYGTIGELVAVTPPSKTRDTIDVTHMASPDGYREFIAALRDGGEASLTFNYTKAGFTVLTTIFDSDALKTFRITLPDASTFVFDGLLTEAPLDNVEVDGKVAMSATIKVSGKPVFTAGA
ncbi:MAG: hypothetical protein EON87_08645 [Brevundimonas sp.]|nr:MAG: hypothetical protein EON87_08645 [Brevundimonas sp.]